MRIVQIVLNKGMGGVEQCAVDYAKCFSKTGHEIHTIIPSEGAHYEKFLREETDSKIHYVKPQNKITLFFPLIAKIIKIKPDFVICHSSKSAILIRIAFLFMPRRFKVIGVDHGINPKKYVKYGKVDYVFCVSSFFTNRINELARGSKVKAYYVPNMIDMGGVEFNGNKKLHKPVRIGMISRIAIGHKGLDIVAVALRKLSDEKFPIEFWIAGDGGQMEEFKNMTRELEVDDKIHYMGWMDDREKFFSEIDIFCMPSRWDTFGISYIEAMKYSTPCIAGDAFGPVDIFEDGVSGFITPARVEGVDEVAKKVAELIKLLEKDKKLYDTMAKNAFDRVKNTYSLDACCRHINDILQEIGGK